MLILALLAVVIDVGGVGAVVVAVAIVSFDPTNFCGAANTTPPADPKPMRNALRTLSSPTSSLISLLDTPHRTTCFVFGFVQLMEENLKEKE